MMGGIKMRRRESRKGIGMIDEKEFEYVCPDCICVLEGDEDNHVYCDPCDKTWETSFDYQWDINDGMGGEEYRVGELTGKSIIGEHDIKDRKLFNK